MSTTIPVLLSITASVISGGALFIMKRYFSKKDRCDKSKDDCKAKESILILRAINAVGKLTLANSIALRDGKTNGEMSSALAEYSAVEKELYNYLLDVNANK